MDLAIVMAVHQNPRALKPRSYPHPCLTPAPAPTLPLPSLTLCSCPTSLTQPGNFTTPSGSQVTVPFMTQTYKGSSAVKVCHAVHM